MVRFCFPAAVRNYRGARKYVKGNLNGRKRIFDFVLQMSLAKHWMKYRLQLLETKSHNQAYTFIQREIEGQLKRQGIPSVKLNA